MPSVLTVPQPVSFCGLVSHPLVFPISLSTNQNRPETPARFYSFYSFSPVLLS